MGGATRFVSSDIETPAPPGVVLVDGRSGSGKTTLAARMAVELGGTGEPAQVLHLDLLYPGWDGLAEGSFAVAAVLRDGWYCPYNWHAGKFSLKRITIDPARPLVIEGCGALTEANLEAAREWVLSAVPAGAGAGNVRAVWLECDEAIRRERALARDGETFAPHWERWAAQEAVHYAAHKPWRLASEVGAAS